MQLYNTPNRKKEEFKPAEENHVRMYACGITAYDYCHIGHARSAVVFDVLVRQLRHLGYKVTFVRNFTDIDDKIIKRANETGVTCTELSERFIDAFYEDMDKLNVVRADLEPKATENIPEMIALTQDLIDKDFAYATQSGDVYFKVRAFDGYGELSGRDVDEMRSGARIAPDEEKEDPLDFALWKSSKPGEPEWESPWGPGRPGWHIECSAMSEKYLGLPMDIHGGGQDLTFPHHENERAQTRAASGKPLARFWVHNGFVMVNAEKMSKSLGNFETIRAILENYLPETVRYFLITKHYRSPIDFTLDNMEEAEKNLKRIYTTRLHMAEALERAKWSKAPLPEDMVKEIDEYEKSFAEAMNDDLNTAAALGHVFGAVRLAGRVLEDKSLRKAEGGKELFTRLLADLDEWSKVLGVFGQEPQEFLDALKNILIKRKGIDPAKVEELMEKRQAARKDKDFAASDAIRDELAAMGVEVRDTPQGAVWDVA
jgi:cysteinyl-tRNA synthetase